MIGIDNSSPNAAIKFARWLAAHPFSPSTAVHPRRPTWISTPRPRLKALVESAPSSAAAASGPVELRAA